jgi:RimJ/RimL family protein N-acetyltransferase
MVAALNGGRPNVVIELRPMSEVEFGTYLAAVTETYAEEQVRAGAWPPEGARERAEAETREMLPDGLATPDHHLYSLVTHDADEPVGALWIMLRDRNGALEAFIADIVVFEAYRRRGYATGALAALDATARELGAGRIRLQVFGHNHAARALYEKMGYETVNVYMDRRLDG